MATSCAGYGLNEFDRAELEEERKLFRWHDIAPMYRGEISIYRDVDLPLTSSPSIFPSDGLDIGYEERISGGGSILMGKNFFESYEFHGSIERFVMQG